MKDRVRRRAILLMGMIVLFLHIGDGVIPGLGIDRAEAQTEDYHRFLEENYADSLIANSTYPAWVSYQLWLRDLAKKFFYQTMKWQQADGRLYPSLNIWRMDDETELFLAWTPYYLLTGDEAIYTAVKKILLVYYARNKTRFEHGYFKDPFPDTEHSMEALILLANLAYVKPGDTEVVTLLRDLVEHCGNFAPGCEPWYNPATRHMRSLGPGTRSIDAKCPYGVDWPFNQQFAKLAFAYYNATKDVNYLNWARDYLDGWINSMDRCLLQNGAPMMPWEVDPQTGAFGACSGKWYDNKWQWGWGWDNASFEGIRDSRGAFLDCYRLTGQRVYVEKMKRMVNFCFDQSANDAPAIYLQNGVWTNDNRCYDAAKIITALSLQDRQPDPAYDARLLDWYRFIDHPTIEQQLWYFRRYNNSDAILSVLKSAVKLVSKNLVQIDSMTAVPPDPDNFPDIEGIEGLTMTAFGGLLFDRGEMPWTEVLYFRQDNSLGLEPGVAGLVMASDDTVRIVSLFNTNSSSRVVKLQADFLPKMIQSVRVNQGAPTPVNALLASVTLPPEQLIQVTLRLGGGDTTPPLPAKNLRLVQATETSLAMAWDPPDPAGDGDTAAGYVIKRNATELARQNGLQFVDSGLSEATAYTYEVMSLDFSGNVSKTGVSASFTTLADATPPVLASAALVDSTHLSLVFSEPVKLASVTALTHYTIAPTASILGAQLLQDKKTVLLHTAAHRDGVNYTLTVTGIQDSSKAMNAMAAAQFKYSFTLPIQAREITPPTYRVEQVAENDSVYVDRNYTLRTIPAGLSGQSRIVTANNDKYATDAAFLTFRVSKHVHVYVAYDRDVTTPPFWLQSWNRTDWLVETSDSPFICFKKYFPPGLVTLGGNEGVGSNSMYLVFMTPAEDASPPAPPSGLWAAPWAGQ